MLVRVRVSTTTITTQYTCVCVGGGRGGAVETSVVRVDNMLTSVLTSFVRTIWRGRFQKLVTKIFKKQVKGQSFYRIYKLFPKKNVNTFFIP